MFFNCIYAGCKKKYENQEALMKHLKKKHPESLLSKMIQQPPPDVPPAGASPVPPANVPNQNDEDDEDLRATMLGHWGHRFITKYKMVPYWQPKMLQVVKDLQKKEEDGDMEARNQLLNMVAGVPSDFFVVKLYSTKEPVFDDDRDHATQILLHVPFLTPTDVTEELVTEYLSDIKSFKSALGVYVREKIRHALLTLVSRMDHYGSLVTNLDDIRRLCVTDGIFYEKVLDILNLQIYTIKSIHGEYNRKDLELKIKRFCKIGYMKSLEQRRQPSIRRFISNQVEGVRAPLRKARTMGLSLPPPVAAPAGTDPSTSIPAPTASLLPQQPVAKLSGTDPSESISAPTVLDTALHRQSAPSMTKEERKKLKKEAKKKLKKEEKRKRLMEEKKKLKKDEKMKRKRKMDQEKDEDDAKKKPKISHHEPPSQTQKDPDHLPAPPVLDNSLDQSSEVEDSIATSLQCFAKIALKEKSVTEKSSAASNKKTQTEKSVTKKAPARSKKKTQNAQQTGKKIPKAGAPLAPKPNNISQPSNGSRKKIGPPKASDGCVHCDTGLVDLYSMEPHSVKAYTNPTAKTKYDLSACLQTSMCLGTCGMQGISLKVGIRYCNLCTDRIAESSENAPAPLSWYCAPCHLDKSDTANDESPPSVGGATRISRRSKTLTAKASDMAAV